MMLMLTKVVDQLVFHPLLLSLSCQEPAEMKILNVETTISKWDKIRLMKAQKDDKDLKDE